MNKAFIVGLALLISQKNFAAIRKSQEIEIKRPAITVAVIDTGADINHRELIDYIWINPGESGKDAFGRDKSNNGVDDDDNGFVDDIHGWNFVDNNNDLLDSMGHGTHVSGIIKNESSKSPLIDKRRNPVRLMILKYYDPDATDAQNIENTVKAINYAVKMRADIINYSGGGSLPNRFEKAAIESANSKHVIFVAAAGNNSKNNDIMNYYPADYHLPNIISVAATDKSGEFVSFSNYGQNTVDIAAPGKQIFSTLPGNKFGLMSGTSQSTAFVTGVVALKLRENPGFRDPQKILEEILHEGQFNKSLIGKTRYQTALVANLANAGP